MCLFKHKVCQCHKCSKKGMGIMQYQGVGWRVGGGRDLEPECFIYSTTGRLTTILYAIIGCLIKEE